MMNDKERRSALSEYAEVGARAQPPVFVGRDAVIEDITNAARIAHRKWASGGADANDPGLTRLVQGAPGAGKTALLRHMQARWANGAGTPGQPIGLRIGVNDLDNPQSLRNAVQDALPTKLSKTLGVAIVRAILKLVPGFLGASGTLADLVGTTVHAAAEVLRGKSRRPFPGPVVLMVDEAQNIAPHSGPAQAVQNLHEGRVGDLPILPVFAGLGYLERHLQREGIKISRYADEEQCIHTLESLSPAECRNMFEGWLGHFGVDDPQGAMDRWADTLILDSQGWAMHTNGFLRALAETLATSDDPASLESADMDTVRRAAARRRAVYYDGRYQGDTDIHRQRVGRALVALNAAGPVRLDAAIQTIGETISADEQQATALFDALVARGFLQQRRPGPHYACPIPSLVRHAAVTAMENPDLHIAAILGRVREVRRLLDEGADIDARDALGRTPLHIASECRWADVTRMLLEAGADLDTPDAHGARPRDIWPDLGVHRDA